MPLLIIGWPLGILINNVIICFGTWYPQQSINYYEYLLPITYTTHVSILVKPWTDNAGSYNASQMGISWTYSSFTLHVFANRYISYIAVGY